MIRSSSRPSRKRWSIATSGPPPTPSARDTGLTMGAMGARGELVPRTAAAGFGLAVTSDVLVVSTTSDAAAGLAATDADVEPSAARA